MLESELLLFLVITGTVMLSSGVWLLFQSFVLFRIHLNDSMNASLDVIKVVKHHKKNPQETGAQKNEKEEIAVMEHLLKSLSDIQNSNSFFSSLMYKVFLGNPKIVFEIAVSSSSEQIAFYISMPTKLRDLVEKQVHSFFPTAHIERVKDYTIFKPGSVTVGSYLKLKKEDSFPIRTYQRLESDPLNNLTTALSKLENNLEGAAIQVVFKRSRAHWRSKGEQVAQRMQQGKHFKDAYSEGIVGKIAKEAGKELVNIMEHKNEEKNRYEPEKNEIVQLTPEENEIIKQLEAKAHKPHFDVNIRLMSSAATKEKAESILAILENAFVQFEDISLNKFVSVRDKTINAHQLAFDFIFRNYRYGQRMVLDTEELASIFHLPISTTDTPKIDWLKSKSAPPPPRIPNEGMLIGYSDFRGTKTDIYLAPNDRRRHLYIIGQTGTGKSTFIEEMAKQDAKKAGMCIIDPHGDLIEHVLESVPKERAEDIIYFDPSDMERPFGFNMLEYDEKRPEQKTFVINEMIAIFDKLYDLRQTGGPMFEQYMRNAMLLVMDSPEIGSTLMEIPRVFRDAEFRKEKLRRCKDMTVVDFWEKEAEKAGGEASLENIVPYITSKLTTFISNDMMRPIIAQQKSTIDFRQAMDEGKILLVYLPKGKIGEINSHLLGMVIVGKLLMAALSRVDLPEDQRKDFYLYIDEFQNFTTDSISQILSEARKYRLCLTIAHQFIGQLSENISKAVFGNVGSMCAFRVGPEDGEFLEKQFAPAFDSNDLLNIDNYNCITKLLINNEASAAFNMKTYPPSKGSIELKQAFKELSRYTYGRSRDIVEREIKERFGLK